MIVEGIQPTHKNTIVGLKIHARSISLQMWPSLISKAKRGGLDVIQTYVFWNLHEPRRGQVDGRNLSPFPLKICGKAHFLPGHISV